MTAYRDLYTSLVVSLQGDHIALRVFELKRHDDSSANGRIREV